ncbi:MAG: MerR family transcriptional regulator [Clostridia bacterium]|nr:MerR family transcriptional regulator [Clostridia bacterium]
MSYTIKEVSEMTGIPASTIRYYDKMGLLPFVERGPHGYRAFSRENLRTLRLVECLKSTGMSLENIRTFFEWVMQGESTMQRRYEMFLEQRRSVEEQIKQLQKTLEIIDYKCELYETAIRTGTADLYENAPERDDPLSADF